MASETFKQIAKQAAEIGFILTEEITTGHVYRECKKCGSYAEFSGLHTLDFSPCRCTRIVQAISTNEVTK